MAIKYIKYRQRTPNHNFEDRERLIGEDERCEQNDGGEGFNPGQDDCAQEGNLHIGPCVNIQHNFPQDGDRIPPDEARVPRDGARIAQDGAQIPQDETRISKDSSSQDALLIDMPNLDQENTEGEEL